MSAVALSFFISAKFPELFTAFAQRKTSLSFPFQAQRRKIVTFALVEAKALRTEPNI